MTERDLKVACDLADAKLATVEEWGFGAAVGWAIAAHLYWHRWYLSVVIFAVIVVFSAHPYRKKSAAAWDAYERHTKTGKHFPYDDPA